MSNCWMLFPTLEVYDYIHVYVYVICVHFLNTYMYVYTYTLNHIQDHRQGGTWGLWKTVKKLINYVNMNFNYYHWNYLCSLK